MSRRFLSENFITSVLKTTDNLKNKTSRDFSKEGATVMWYQLLSDTLLNIPYGIDKNINREHEEMIAECRSQYANNEHELRKIDQFDKYYEYKQALYWLEEGSYQVTGNSIYRYLSEEADLSHIMIFSHSKLIR